MGAHISEAGSRSVGRNWKSEPTAASRVKNHCNDLDGNSKQNRKKCVPSPHSRPYREWQAKQKSGLQSPSTSIPRGCIYSSEVIA